jgi:hypothetical protein
MKNKLPIIIPIFISFFVALGSSCNGGKPEDPATTDSSTTADTIPFWNYGNNSIKTVGVYLWPSGPESDRDYKYWRACGYNTIQFLMTGVSFTSPDVREANLVNMNDRIIRAQHAGFRTGIVILSNISTTGTNFDPRDSVQMQKRLNDIKLIIQRLSRTNTFTLVAGDPGGSPVALGRQGVGIWFEMARKVHQMVNQYAPKANYNVNIWAIAYWDYDHISPFSIDFWQKEVEYGKAALSEKNLIGPGCGVEIPLHNYYRSLALKEYADAGITPELFPNSADASASPYTKAPRRWSWPYFLIDEVDDGYTGYGTSRIHPTQSETRYIEHIVAVTRDLGMNGIIANVDIADNGIETEALNLYALGRFCKDSTLTAGKTLDEFSGFIADKESKPILGQILRFIENHSTWEKSLPEQYRLKDFDCNYTTAGEALDALSKVKPNPSPDFPIPFPPDNFINRIRTRLQDIQTSGQ